MSAGNDESASSPSSPASPKFPVRNPPQRTTGRQATIPESEENEENGSEVPSPPPQPPVPPPVPRRIRAMSSAHSTRVLGQTELPPSQPKARIPPPVPRRNRAKSYAHVSHFLRGTESPSSPPSVRVPPPVPRRKRAMSSAHLTHFLGSTASAARRSLALKASPDLMSAATPQFLTVSPGFSVRDQSRSPSPAVPRFGRTRHSIDVRNFPSYLQRKRTSLTLGAGKILQDLAEVATSPFEPSSPEQLKPLNEPLYEEPEAPVLSLGERVAWVNGGGAVMTEFGIVKWIGRMPQICRTWTVGVEFDNAIGSGDGRFGGRRYFTAKENFAKFLPLAALTRVDYYVGRPRSGTLLSRMSVQLKPGQLISVQRTPSIHHLAHCALNAPHHVDHDVHAPNMEHCLCHNCNHPCAHLCKTRQSKGKKGRKDVKIAHMCHFSHKPHGVLCCGGEDLLYESITSPKTSIPADTLCDTHYVAEERSEHSSRSRCKGSKSETRETRKQSNSSTRRSSSLPPPPSDAAGPCEECNQQPADGQEVCSRSSSVTSVASLPSSTSPVEVFIAHGALTDESDVDFDLLHSIAARTPSELSFGERGRVSGGLRSLVSCLVPGISYQKTGRSVRSHRKRSRNSKTQQTVSNQIAPAVSMDFSDNFKDHHISGSVHSTRSSSRSHASRKNNGLSTSPEDLESGRAPTAESPHEQTVPSLPPAKSSSSIRRSSSLPPPSEAVGPCEECLQQGPVNGHALGSRSASETSVASLPPTASPVEVFIARGALTDESDVDFDVLHSIVVRTSSEPMLCPHCSLIQDTRGKGSVGTFSQIYEKDATTSLKI